MLNERNAYFNCLHAVIFNMRFYNLLMIFLIFLKITIEKSVDSDIKTNKQKTVLLIHVKRKEIYISIFACWAIKHAFLSSVDFFHLFFFKL